MRIHRPMRQRIRQCCFKWILCIAILCLNSGGAIKVKMTRRPSTTDSSSGDDPPPVKKMKSWDWTHDQHVEFSSSKEKSMSKTLFRETVGRIQSIFAQGDRPLRDAWDGFKSAFSIAWEGYYQGFEGLVFDYPWRGMDVDGAVGWFKGFGLGVVHFGAMTFSGVSAGLYQAARGIECAFEAVSCQSAGMRFDKSKGWFFYSLDEEIQQGGHDMKTPPKRHLRKHVKDTRFYEILNVGTSASPSEIKKAYYRQALETHPDKNHESLAPDDFLSLTTAYKTLMSEETRELYDKHGKCFAEHVQQGSMQVDPYIFFGTFFGSSFVEPYVGDLAVATIVDNALMLTDKAEQISFTEASYESKQQRHRQLQIANHLRDRIESFVTGSSNEEQFRFSCRREAFALGIAMDEQQAGLLFNGISSGLVSATYQFLLPPWMKKAFNFASGAFDTSAFFDATQNLHVMVALQRELRKAIHAVESELPKMNFTDDSYECNDKKTAKDVDSLLKKLSVPRMVKLVWKFNLNDIARTLKEATGRVLDDCGEDYALRLRKATALNILGREFHSAVTVKSAFGTLDADIIDGDVQAALLESIIREGINE